MKSVKGDLEIMSLPDIMQWAEKNKKTGTLTIGYRGIAKMFYFQDGKIIFVSSQKEGERLGEFLTRIGNIEKGKLREAIKESQRVGVSFTGFLISEGIIDGKMLEHGIERLAETALVDALTWDSGTFVFTHEMPAAVQNGTIKINTSTVISQSLRMVDEIKNKDRFSPDIENLMKQFAKRIAEGNIDLPVIPDIMYRLNKYVQNDAPIHDIAKLIMSDQILTSKILKVVNSVFYSPPYKITSMHQAIIFMGFKTMLSIVTMHSLSNISSKNTEKIKEILHHSLLCALIAKRLAVDVHIDPEEAFVCGLLHDIGKTALLNSLTDYNLSKEIMDRLLEDYHQQAGVLIATKWNLSELVRNAVRYHHNPEAAPSHREIVETLYLANTLAKGPDELNIPQDKVQMIHIDDINIKQILDELQDLNETVSTMI